MPQRNWPIHPSPMLYLHSFVQICVVGMVDVRMMASATAPPSTTLVWCQTAAGESAPAERLGPTKPMMWIQRIVMQSALARVVAIDIRALCECYDGYTGMACERMNCPLECSGHGQCYTLGTMYEIYNYTRPQLDTYLTWDTDKTMGCACDYGYTGGACELRMCPKGTRSSGHN